MDAAIGHLVVSACSRPCLIFQLKHSSAAESDILIVAHQPGGVSASLGQPAAQPQPPGNPGFAG